MLCSRLSSNYTDLGVAAMGYTFIGSFSNSFNGSFSCSLVSLGDSGAILAKVRSFSFCSSFLDSMNSLTSKGNSKSHFSSFSSFCATYSSS